MLSLCLCQVAKEHQIEASSTLFLIQRGKMIVAYWHSDWHLYYYHSRSGNVEVAPKDQKNEVPIDALEPPGPKTCGAPPPALSLLGLK